MKPVLYGIERSQILKNLFKGKRIGLVTNPTGLDRSLRRSVDLLAEISRLVCLFGPEHGIDGGAQAGSAVTDAVDSRTRLPVYSLYGPTRRPAPTTLEGLDTLVFDIQDVGLRWYTYPWTLSYVMEACAEAKVPLVVLDRPNPLGGHGVEGLQLDESCRSFIGRFPVPARHGLTLGEMARHLARVHLPGVDLTVIPCQNWKADQLWPATRLPWISPSPNLPTFDSLLAYAALTFLEGTNVSEGRGTTRPFEQFGAPWLDHETLVHSLRALNLPGLLWRPVFFTPTFSKFSGQLCRGISLHITNPQTAPLFEAGLRVHHLLKKLHPEYLPLPPWKEGSQPPLALLFGTLDILGDTTVEALLTRSAEVCRAWNQVRQPDLMYER